MIFKSIYRNTIFLLFLVGQAFLLHAQSNLIIHLAKSKADTLGIFPRIAILTAERRIIDKRYFKNIPDVKSVHLYKCIFDLNQQAFTDYLADSLTQANFFALVNHWHIDTLMLYRGKLRNSVYVVNYYDSILKKGVVIIDQNFDNDFSDDPKIYSLDSSGQKFPKISLSGVQLFNGIKVLNQPLIVKPGFSTVMIISKKIVGSLIREDTIKNNFQIVMYPYVRYTDILANGGKYRLYIMSSNGLNKGFSDKFYMKYGPLAEAQPDPLDDPVLPLLGKGDELFINNRTYVVDSANYEGSKLFLGFKNSREKHIGYMKGAIAGLIEGTDIRYGDVFTTYSIKNKWVLLDFWGTWCGPCVANIPVLKKFYNKYKSKLQLISIACENKTQADSVLSFTKQHGMNWPQFYEVQGRWSTNSSFEYRFKVNEYPTSILIDKSGKIVFRGIGDEDGLKKMSKMVDNE